MRPLEISVPTTGERFGERFREVARGYAVTMSESEELVEPEGVNAGGALAERDRRPDGQVPATGGERLPPPPADGNDELAGAPGQDEHTPGQQLEAGEG